MEDGAIYVMNATGSDQSKLAPGGGGGEWRPAVWSPHAGKIVFQRDCASYVMKADGTRQGKLASGGRLSYRRQPAGLFPRFVGPDLQGINGAYRDRTGDLRLAKPALSQLS